MVLMVVTVVVLGTVGLLTCVLHHYNHQYNQAVPCLQQSPGPPHRRFSTQPPPPLNYNKKTPTTIITTATRNIITGNGNSSSSNSSTTTTSTSSSTSTRTAVSVMNAARAIHAPLTSTSITTNYLYQSEYYPLAQLCGRYHKCYYCCCDRQC